MTQETVTDAEVWRLLLGDVDDETRERIEILFISDPEFRERVLIAEEELIEEYLEGALRDSDRERFLVQFGSSPQQRRKLRIAKSLKKSALAEAAEPALAKPVQKQPSVVSKWRSFFGPKRRWNPYVFVPVALAVTVAIVFGVIWLKDLNSRMAEERRRQKIEQEIADLNSPSNISQPTPLSLSILLPPVSVRSAAAPPELPATTMSGVVELRLISLQNRDYPSYRAVLRRVGSTDEYAINNLHAETIPDGKILRVKLPTDLLTRGLYVVRLYGVASEGEPALMEEYTFMVGG